MITVCDCYKAVSDLISDCYDWLSNEDNKDIPIQYILGLNDMARYLAEMIDDDKGKTEEEKDV